MKKIVLLFALFFTYLTLVSCDSSNSESVTTTSNLESETTETVMEDLQFNFTELEWEDTNYSSNSLVELITIDSTRYSEIFIYLYIPQISLAPFFGDNITIKSEYYTTCPTNYLSICSEKLDDSYLEPKVFDWHYIEREGYIVLQFPTIIAIDDDVMNYTYDYHLTNLGISINDYLNLNRSTFVQDAKMLISVHEYSDSEIPSKFE